MALRALERSQALIAKRSMWADGTVSGEQSVTVPTAQDAGTFTQADDLWIPAQLLPNQPRLDPSAAWSCLALAVEPAPLLS